MSIADCLISTMTGNTPGFEHIVFIEKEFTEKKNLNYSEKKKKTERSKRASYLPWRLSAIEGEQFLKDVCSQESSRTYRKCS